MSQEAEKKHIITRHVTSNLSKPNLNKSNKECNQLQVNDFELIAEIVDIFFLMNISQNC